MAALRCVCIDLLPHTPPAQLAETLEAVAEAERDMSSTETLFLGSFAVQKPELLEEMMDSRSKAGKCTMTVQRCQLMPGSKEVHFNLSSAGEGNELQIEPPQYSTVAITAEECRCFCLVFTEGGTWG